MQNDPQGWMAHMDSLLNLLHFAELHPNLFVETISKESYDKFVKATKIDEDTCENEEKTFYAKAQKCLEGLKIFAENFDIEAEPILKD